MYKEGATGRGEETAISLIDPFGVQWTQSISLCMVRFKIRGFSMNFKLKSIITYLDRHNSCLNVSFTACLTSLIFKQYSNGFNDEFKYNKVAVNCLERYTDKVILR